MRDDIDFGYFKKCLEQRLQELTEGRKTVPPLELDQSRIGRLTRMDAMQQQAITQAAERLSVMEEQRIRSALDRMASGDYGYCANCDEEIAEGRLRVDPSVRTCITCARAMSGE